jgi:hypothetical protein
MTPGRMLVDLGPPVTPERPAMSWEATRHRTIAAQDGHCAHCRHVPPGGVLDVVKAHEGGYVALCRSCRCKRDAPSRLAKAALTRGVRRGQMRLPGAGRRRRRAPPSLDGRELLAEALTELEIDATAALPWYAHPAGPRDGALALFTVLRRHGLVIENVPPARSPCAA